MEIRIILFAIFTIPFVCIQMQAQDELPYQSRAVFKTDTLQYLEYNYNMVRNEKYYKSRTMGDILEELEYPVLYVAERAWCGSKLMAIDLGIRQTDEEPNPLEDYYITVYFAYPPQISDYRELYDSKDDRSSPLTPQIYDFIKNLRAAWVTFSRPLN